MIWQLLFGIALISLVKGVNGISSENGITRNQQKETELECQLFVDMLCICTGVDHDLVDVHVEWAGRRGLLGAVVLFHVHVSNFIRDWRRARIISISQGRTPFQLLAE